MDDIDELMDELKEAGDFTRDDMRWMEHVRNEGLMRTDRGRYRKVWNVSPAPFIPSHRRTWRENYEMYLLSDAWDRTRGIALIEAHNCCRRCGWRADYKGTGLEVHHKTYKHLYNEPQEDLEVLCHSCHEIADQERALRNKRG